MGRVGFHLSESFFAALDGRYMIVRFKNSANDYSSDAVGYNLAPVIGMQMPNFGLRVWGSYILMGELDPESSNSTDVIFEDARGVRIGVGFHINSLSLNLEYEDIEYGNTTLEKIGPFTSSSESDSINLTTKSYILSLSFPIEI